MSDSYELLMVVEYPNPTRKRGSWTCCSRVILVLDSHSCLVFGWVRAAVLANTSGCYWGDESPAYGL